MALNLFTAGGIDLKVTYFDYSYTIPAKKSGDCGYTRVTCENDVKSLNANEIVAMIPVIVSPVVGIDLHQSIGIVDDGTTIFAQSTGVGTGKARLFVFYH